MMVLGKEERLVCEVVEVFVDERKSERVSEFKYLGFVLDESGTYSAKCCRKDMSWRRVEVSNLIVQGCCMKYCLFLF